MITTKIQPDHVWPDPELTHSPFEFRDINRVLIRMKELGTTGYNDIKLDLAPEILTEHNVILAAQVIVFYCQWLGSWGEFEIGGMIDFVEKAFDLMDRKQTAGEKDKTHMRITYGVSALLLLGILTITSEEDMSYVKVNDGFISAVWDAWPSE